MKILQVIPYLNPKMGGDVNVVYNLSKNLANTGHEVTILTTNFGLDYEYINQLKLNNIDIVICDYTINLRPTLISFKAYSYLKNNMRHFDIIHVHNVRTFLNILVHYFAMKYNVPYVLQAHGDVPYVNIKSRRKKILDILFGYAILRDASKLIALTETEIEDYKKMGVDDKKIKVVPNGIDLSEYDNLPERGEFRRKYSIRDDEKIILYLGRIHKTKGIDSLVKAFFDISKELDNVRLVVCGPDDGYQSVLEKIIKELKVDDTILFTGFVINDEKIAAFVDADVFVTPSFLGFPVTFLEACACGTPIITTNGGDKLDWIHDNVGYVVECDKDRLRDVIYKVLCDDVLRKRFGEEGKRLVKKEFSEDKIVKAVEKLYSGCIHPIGQKVT